MLASFSSYRTSINDGENMKLYGFLGQINCVWSLLLLPALGFAQDLPEHQLPDRPQLYMEGNESLAIETEENELLSFPQALSGLKVRSLSKLGQAIEVLSQITNPRTAVVLQALLDGNLYIQRDNGQIVIGEEKGDVYRIFTAVSGHELEATDQTTIKKIKLSNRLRTQLRVIIAGLQLHDEDAAIRLQAVKEIAKQPDEQAINLLKALNATEQDESVREALTLILAIQDLDSTDKTVRLAAIELLKQETSREALNRLQALTATDSDGHYLEADKDIRKQAKSALVKMESRLHWFATAETVFFGLSLGAVLVLAAIGLTITFGVMGVINMAHGELMMLGAYTTYVMQQLMPNHIGVSLLLAIPAAFIISGLVGIGIERGIIRFLYGRPLETLLATFGISLFLQQTVRSIFSPLNRSVSTPEWMSGSWQINEFLAFTWNRLFILIFCLLVFAVLLQILRRTRLGLEVRAVSQNRNMAKAMGIPTDRVDAMTFGLGSGIAGVAGVALSQITNVGPNLGQAYIVDSFMVVVFGGVGNLWGTLVAGFSLGIANKVLEPVAGAVLAKIVVLVFIILFIQKRPRGLFPQKGRAAES
jgi:urea transport system permease protein